MKKITLYISIIVLIIVFTAGATFAYLVTTENSIVNSITAEGAEIKVIYTGGKKIEGPISLSENKDGGLNTTINIKLDVVSAPVKTDLYINVNKISSSLASEGFKWEVYKNNETTAFSSGNFLDCQNGNGVKNCAVGDRLYIVKDYKTPTTNTTFTVYVWLDGNLVGNEVLGASFSGIIEAESEKFTGHLE